MAMRVTDAGRVVKYTVVSAENVNHSELSEASIREKLDTDDNAGPGLGALLGLSDGVMEGELLGTLLGL